MKKAQEQLVDFVASYGGGGGHIYLLLPYRTDMGARGTFQGLKERFLYLSRC